MRDLGSEVLDVWELYFGSLILEEIKKCKGREGEKGGGKRAGRGPPAWNSSGAGVRPWAWGTQRIGTARPLQAHIAKGFN